MGGAPISKNFARDRRLSKKNFQGEKPTELLDAKVGLQREAQLHITGGKHPTLVVKVFWANTGVFMYQVEFSPRHYEIAKNYMTHSAY